MDDKVISSVDKSEKSKKELFEKFKRKTDFYLKKPIVDDINLYYYVKDFFKEYLEIDKELSFEEIIQEIEKTYINKQSKQSLVSYLKKISYIEYKDIEYDEDEIKDFIKEFFEIVKNIPQENFNKKNFFSKVLKKIGLKKDDSIVENYELKKKKEKKQPLEKEPETSSEKEDSTYLEETEKSDPSKEQAPIEKEKKEIQEIVETPLQEIKEEPETTTKIDDLTAIKELFSKAKRLRRKEKLIAIYKEINSLYEDLSVVNKAEIYPDLLGLYEKISKK